MTDPTSRPDSGPDPLLGRSIGSYVILERLGRGGMGSVYKAEHHLIGKKVAIKVLSKEFATNEILVQRFFNEARAVNKIGHDNIVDISDYGKTDDGWIYYVMELLEGRELTKLIKEAGQLDLPRAIHITRQCAQALDACHAQGIIHRDLKPDNIFLITHGGREDFVKVLDFGVAKLADEETGYTKQGAVLGTPHYMSPEQAEGHPIDQRADVYSLGVILYRMLTGKVPFPGTTFSSVIAKVLTEPARPPSGLNPKLSPAVDAVVLKCLSKLPEERFSSALEFLDALEKAANLDPLTAEALGSSVKVPTPALGIVAMQNPGQSAASTAKKNSTSWADGLPRLPDDTLNGAQTQAGLPPQASPSQQLAPAPVANNSTPWLIAGISLGVALALGGLAVLWIFVLRKEPTVLVAPPNVALSTPAPNPNPTPNPNPNPAPNTTPSGPTPPAVPALSKVSFTSSPAGAKVIRAKDKKNTVLGLTPWTLDPLPKQAEEYRLVLFGYEEQRVTLDPAAPKNIDVSLVQKAPTDKEMADFLNGLRKADAATFAAALDPKGGLAFFSSPSAPKEYREKMFNNKSGAIDFSVLSEKDKPSLQTITRESLQADEKLLKSLQGNNGFNGYNPILEEGATWRCVAAEMYCSLLRDDPDAPGYSKANFSYQNGGLYLVKLAALVIRG
jgi:serine/threonine-protein kinase